MLIAVASRAHATASHALLNYWEQEPSLQLAYGCATPLWENQEHEENITVDDSYARYYGIFTDRLRQDSSEDALRAVSSPTEDPYAVLDALFQEILARSSEMYSAAAEWAPVGAELSVAHYNDCPYKDQPACGELGTAAKTQPADKRGIVRIEVQFIPKLLGPPSWSALPYLLFHELICHASQASPMEAADPFVEGWMDYVAFLVHHEYIEEVFGWAPVNAKRSAENLHALRQRQIPGGSQDRKARSARSYGCHVAEVVQQRLTKLLGERNSFYEFISLSIRLNRIEASVSEHCRFISAIAAAVSGGDGLSETRLAAALRKSVEEEAGAPLWEFSRLS